MPKKSYRQAINEALTQEMERDHRVVVMGEDIAGGLGAPGEQDAWGGPLGVTKGLMPKFGRERVLDTPITESGFIGAAVGAAATGLRPVAELMFVDFMGVCFDQIFNQAAKFKYMFGGKAVTPLVVRTMYGAGFRAASQHSQCLYNVFTHIPGLKVVLPSNPYEAKGLLIQAIRDDDPVIFFEHKAMYDMEGEVPDEAYAIPFGEANVTREGDDATIIAFGRMVIAGQDQLLAGASLPLGVGIVNVMRFAQVDLPTAIAMASSNPARLLGAEASSLEAGSMADLVLFDLPKDDEPASLRIRATLVGGELVYGELSNL